MKKVTFKAKKPEEPLEHIADEPKEWSADEFKKGAEEYVKDNGEFEYTAPEPKEVDWAQQEAAIEEAINADFDRTYADADMDLPFYKRWWFWLIALLVLAVAIIAILFKTGHMPGQFLDEGTTNTTTVAEIKLDGPQEQAQDFTLPEDAEVISGYKGWGVYQYGSLVPSYNGIASNKMGTWYIKDGLVDFTYTGYLTVNNNTYKVTEGKVDVANPVVTQSAANTAQSANNTASGQDSTVTGQTQTSAAQTPQGQEYADGTEAQQDALASAVDYINQMAFSRDWLIAQLVSDGVDTNDAAWAADHTGADWNEQAHKKAEEYLKLTSFNHKDMVDQLVFEGFTADQAEYGATKAGL